MIQASQFLEALKANRFGFYSGTPCSYLQPFINAVIDDPQCRYLDATNEGDAVAMVCGAHLACGGQSGGGGPVAGRRGLVMFQNSGLGNAVNALTSLVYPFRFPLLLIVTHRGEPGGAPDEPQHEQMGRITTPLLDTLEIPWELFPETPEAIGPALARATAHMDGHQRPYCLVMRSGAVAPQKLQAKPSGEPIGNREFTFAENLTLPYDRRATRTDALRVVLARRQSRDVVIATTGKTGRELFSLEDHPSHFYTVGSMGSASALALGAALHLPDHRVVCLDGDGAVLMRMGNLVSVGEFSPPRFLHIVLDNESHDSTGGQSTPTAAIALGGVARACGYPEVYSLDKLEDLDALLARTPRMRGPVFVHFRIKLGSPETLGRPTIKPPQVKERLMTFIRQNGHGG
ncbi:MAG: phosphonopyruvate decarboxylase [Deltaproteobacteria bacterium]|nr:phosphonopyruvate decarboxylase [Deltaproteobacteria bacterium]